MTTERITVGAACADVCWQRLIRDHHNSLPRPERADLASAVVQPVSRQTAAAVILRYEWLGTMAPTTHHYGVYFDGWCGGVTCVGFSAGANLYAHRMFGVERHELAYLARGACVHWAPTGTNSKLVAWTAKLLRRDAPARLMIAYADEDAGEIGTIYQACGWQYIGRGSATMQYVRPDGRVFDQKAPYDLARERGGTRREWHDRLIADGWTVQQSNPKHRYVCVLDKRDRELRERIDALATDYPKRAKRATTGDQSARGGSTPTRALHLPDLQLALC